MRLLTEDGIFEVATESYTLRFQSNSPFVRLSDGRGEQIAELFVLSSVHPLNGRDDTVEIGSWEVTESAGGLTLSLRAASSIWDEKIYRFRCGRRRFTYEVEVVGQGQLAEVNYFGGYYSGELRRGSGFFWSGQSFKRGFNPEPNMEEINHFPPNGNSVIDLLGVPLPGKGSWFFTPPPFCYAMEGAGGWLGLGVETRPGENRFTEYKYVGNSSSFHLALSYEGHTTVEGRYRLPAIGFDFGRDEYEVLEGHVAALRAARLVPTRPSRPHAAWWKEPIFCGWGSQCYEASLEQGHAPAYARQSLYEQFMRSLAENDLSPGIVVLDDKWQATYGENRADERKWPDLRGFVEEQHRIGRKVLLWLKAWDPEGVPAELCIRNAAGHPLAVDPSNPAYEKMLRESVRNMLSADGYDADGFKIDFSARIPSGPGIELHGDVWGLELMRLYLGIIYDEAARTKPDALVMAHTPHPYLADVIDMIRLNDINVGKDTVKAMRLRARVASIACPEALIDTDNWPITDRAAWRSYIRLQAELGIPSLYYASHIDSTKEPLEQEDYQLVREIWAEYRARVAEGATESLAA